jgi:hypothetical protein
MTARRAVVAGVVGGLLLAAAVDIVTLDPNPAGPSGFATGWKVTSGSWNARGAYAVTSAPTFRAHTVDRHFGNVSLSVKFRIDGYERGGHAWDGVHFGFRYHSQFDLYYVSVARRDGTVVVKRKVGGKYLQLASVPHTVAVGVWHHAHVEVRSGPSGPVGIVVEVDDAVVRVNDRQPGKLRGRGGISVRSDNVRANFDDLSIRALESGS